MNILQEIFAVVFLLISGVVMIKNPRFVWRVEHFFTVKDGEPTDLYINIVRVIGGVCILAVVLLELVFFIFGR